MRRQSAYGVQGDQLRRVHLQYITKTTVAVGAATTMAAGALAHPVAVAAPRPRPPREQRQPLRGVRALTRPPAFVCAHDLTHWLGSSARLDITSSLCLGITSGSYFVAPLAFMHLLSHKTLNP